MAENANQTATIASATSDVSRDASEGNWTQSRPIEPELAKHLVQALRESRPTDNEAVPEAASALLYDAVQNRATDVHLDPESRGYCVRFRIDGAMRNGALLTAAEGGRLTNQIKTMGTIDPVPQFSAEDSRVTLEMEDRVLDLRLAVIPCLHGEKMSIRILDPKATIRSLDQLGMRKEDCDAIRDWYQSMGGMFLVCGPIGMGKTTTLYALLQSLELHDRSIVTLEDPVEYAIDGVNQIPVGSRREVDFCEGLTAIARHDPDIILVGELRDRATARAVYRASSLGRTVFGTLHARDAVATVDGLRHLGLDDRDIATNLAVVIAQRLVRCLCESCRYSRQPNDDEREWIEWIGEDVPSEVWGADGCDDCAQTGYHGRTGVFEVWRLNDADYYLLRSGASEREFREDLVRRGHRRLITDAIEKASQGITSLDEVRSLRLVGLMTEAENRAAEAASS